MSTHTSRIALLQGLISLLLFFGSPSLVFGQEEDWLNIPIDSAISILDERLHIDSLKMETLETGYMLLQKAKREEHPLQIASCHLLIGGWHDYYGVYEEDSIGYHYKQALAIYEKQGMKAEIAEIQLSLSTYYLNNTTNIGCTTRCNKS